MTLDFLAPAYSWVKALHLIAVISWMAGMLYLPRLFVYHSEIAPGGVEHARFVTMERRLLKAIINPAMAATWLLGLTLVLTPGVIDWKAGWWHTKLLCVLLMSGFHGYLSKNQRAFAADERPKNQRHWRIMNEMPTLLMIVIVIMVIVKPF
ncbi:protoporphyrinogen oxidase HemJ [Roseococcus sp. YIM B11640]|uniref:protoporphyrinogen oxidase HemJ n=1 Tax=Roseococcus sp. YIM B11640 TaxID=3133973 RepID=UPI003C7B0089